MSTQNRKKRPAAEYEPTKQEFAVISKLREKLAEWVPRVKVSMRGDFMTITPDHPNDTIGYLLLMEALGTTDLNYVKSFLNQLAIASSLKHGADERQLNFMLSIIASIGPRDQVEAMLAAQMAAVHMATMTFARRLTLGENIPQLDSAERAFNKLTRTFATQMESLKRYRTGGEQKVTVQHVSVGEGGQAIVGNVTQSRRENAPEQTVAAPPAITQAKTVPMPIIGESKESVTVPARRRRDK